MVHGVGFFIFLLPMVAGECSEFGVCLVNNLNLVGLLLLSNDKCRSVFSVFIFNPVFKTHTKKYIRYSLKN